MRALLAADWVRFGHRRDLQILVVLVPVILAVMFISDFNSATTPPQINYFFDPPDPVLEAQVRAQALADFQQQLATVLPAFAFPASLIKVAGNFGPVALLAIYVVMALVAGEFDWGTVRTLHLTASRRRTLAVRVVVITGIVALVVAAGLLFATVIPFLLSFEGRPLQDYAAPVPNLFTEIALRFLLVLPFIGIPVFMALLARSMVTTFLFTLLFFVADTAITAAPFWSGSAAPWVPAVTISGSLSRLVGGPDVPLASVAPAWVSVAAVVAWAVVPVLVAILHFHRLDLEE